MKLDLKFADRFENMEPSAIREILKLANGSDITSFAGGLPAPEVFPKGKISWVSAKVLEEYGQSALQYSNTEGLDVLRKQILHRMDYKMGVKGLTLENIVMISGSQQGLDFTAKIFCNKGDVVFVEKPTYLAAINAFKSYEAKVVEIEMDKDGIIIEDLKKKMAMYPDAKFLYIIPDFQNPTGISMPLERRKDLMEAIKDSSLMVLEDSPYTELRYEGERIPTLLSLDTDGRVIYLGTFSKILAPGFRLGWVIADKDIIAKMVIAKQAADLQPNTLTQYIASEFLSITDIEQHIESIIKVYGHRRNVMLKALETYMPSDVTWTHPQGGLFLWITFPEGVDSKKLLQECIKRKVAFVPGEPFFAESPEKNHCRMNFSFVDDSKIEEGIKLISESLRAYQK
ncbi:MAG: PLP-dependent aminotransferase family protein [Erysipelotrichaceae bacterium]|nr:PLP-dependent aminotransferase family protein [Erysipelotrichaceae bacterium]